MANPKKKSLTLANNPEFLALIEQSRASFKKNGGISLEELRRELGLKVKRRQRRRKRT